MKSGAVDFLPKPFNDQDLIDAVNRALERDVAERGASVPGLGTSSAASRTLTERERQVFAGVVAGKLNKQIGHDLGIAEKTVKVHRANVMTKMRAESLADLVRMAERTDRISAPRAETPWTKVPRQRRGCATRIYS